MICSKVLRRGSEAHSPSGVEMPVRGEVRVGDLQPNRGRQWAIGPTDQTGTAIRARGPQPGRGKLKTH